MNRKCWGQKVCAGVLTCQVTYCVENEQWASVQRNKVLKWLKQESRTKHFFTCVIIMQKSERNNYYYNIIFNIIHYRGEMFVVNRFHIDSLDNLQNLRLITIQFRSNHFISTFMFLDVVTENKPGLSQRVSFSLSIVYKMKSINSS